MTLPTWADAHQEEVRGHLRTAGGILFRGFRISGAGEFEQAVRALSGDPLAYKDRSSPRSQVAGNVYTSTDHPADHAIFLHNEQSYSNEWPGHIVFCCLRPGTSGGRTPVADIRTVYRLLDPEITERFARLGVMYVRNFSEGLGLSWQTAFQTEERAKVEHVCRHLGMAWEWLDGGRLRTRHVRPAVIRHPETGERAWFNHGTFFHVSTLERTTREVLLKQFRDEDLPQNTYYGDGSPIDPDVLDALRAAYHAAEVSFDWQVGDVLLLDNMLMAHGRSPYRGERTVLVAMTSPVGWADVRTDSDAERT